MARYYMLRGSEVTEEPDYGAWSEWYQNSYEKIRCVAVTRLRHTTVTTVFLAMNMALSKDDPPLLFETTVEGGWLDSDRQRYSSLEEAKSGHEAVVARARAAEEENELPPPGLPAW